MNILRQIYSFIGQPVFKNRNLYPRVKKLSSDIFGLKYKPSLEPKVSDEVDSFALYYWLKVVPREFSQRDARVLKKELLRLGGRCQCILEIGVCRNRQASSTKVLLANKKKTTIYLGVDIEDKSFLNDSKQNIYTLCCGSQNKTKVLKKLKALGYEKIDLLMIDGCHSVKMTINDWSYAEYLSPAGVVVMHDTSVHPGPVVVFEAVDENLFEKQKYFADLPDDWGITVIRKK